MTIEPVQLDADGDAGDALRRIVGERGKDAMFYRLFANSPRTLEAIWQLVSSMWTSELLDRAHVELIILRVSQLTNASYEWVHHVPMARTAGVTDEQMLGLERWEKSEVFDDLQRDVLAATDQVVEGREVDTDVAQRLTEKLGAGAVVEILTTAGLYTLIAGVLKTARAGFEEWAPLDDPIRFPGNDPSYPAPST